VRASRFRGAVFVSLLLAACGSPAPSGGDASGADHAATDTLGEQTDAGAGDVGPAEPQQDGAFSEDVSSPGDAAADATWDVAGEGTAGDALSGDGTSDVGDVAGDGRELRDASAEANDASDADDPCLASGAKITTDKSSYLDTDPFIEVTFSGLRGDDNDQIVLARTSDLAGNWRQSYRPKDTSTGVNLVSGRTSFTEREVGTYVIRYQGLGERIFCRSAPFAVITPGPTKVSTDKATYVSGQVISVTYVNLPNTGLNWLFLAVPGSPVDKQLDYHATNTPSGTNGQFTAPAAGEYVIRAVSQTMVLLAESPKFTVTPKPPTTPTVSTDKAAYPLNSTIIVTYSDLPGNPNDLIELALSTDSDASYRDLVRTNGQMSGMATFKITQAGSYVVRAHVNGTTTVLTRSSVFTVGN
jgi:hypothetical protein